MDVCNTSHQPFKVSELQATSTPHLFSCGVLVASVCIQSSRGQVGPRSCVHTCTWLQCMCAAVLRQPRVFQQIHIVIQMCESACENRPRGAFTVQDKMHACLISLVLPARSHRNSTLWMFSLLCEHNAGWETVERTRVHLRSPSPSLRPLQFISSIGSRGGKVSRESPVAF